MMKKIILCLCLINTSMADELIAHRGVHQTYDREGLTSTTCTATRIKNSDHKLIENTLESIEKAFYFGASMVEVDVHPTTEYLTHDHLVIFHDWTLDCRTDASCILGCHCNDRNECVTNEQPLSYLSTLDVGYGYTNDKGITFPFRGQLKAKMPRFEETLDLLEHHYKDKKLLVNVKGNMERTGIAFLRIIKNYPISVRRRLYYPYKYGFQKELEAAGVKDQIDQSAKECFKLYLIKGWYGHFPNECRNKRLFVPIKETFERIIGRPGKLVKFTTLLWGWPEKFIQLAHEHGTEVYASQVDSEQDYHEMKKLNLDGIMTNRIELIGPL